MSTFKFIIRDQNKYAKSIISLLREIAAQHEFVTEEPIETPNKETLKAMKDAKSGKVFRAKNTKDLFKQILG